MRPLLGLLAWLACSPAWAESAACNGYDELNPAGASLPELTAVLAHPGHLDILAIGSASIFGPEATLASTGSAPPASPSAASPSAFPEVMAHALEAAVPTVSVSVTVRGGRGLTAGDQVQLLETALHDGHYQLVIWQTGTVEAVRNLPPSDFAQHLADGARAVEAAGANLVLIDPQFSRFLQTNSNLDPYQQAVQQVGALPGVMLFHRFDLMRAWANDGVIDLERAPKADRPKLVRKLHTCLGEHLARALISATRP